MKREQEERDLYAQSCLPYLREETVHIQQGVPPTYTQGGICTGCTPTDMHREAYIQGVHLSLQPGYIQGVHLSSTRVYPRV